jgi:hypothetical protein
MVPAILNAFITDQQHLNTAPSPCLNNPTPHLPDSEFGNKTSITPKQLKNQYSMDQRRRTGTSSPSKKPAPTAFATQNRIGNGTLYIQRSTSRTQNNEHAQ